MHSLACRVGASCLQRLAGTTCVNCLPVFVAASIGASVEDLLYKIGRCEPNDL